MAQTDSVELASVRSRTFVRVIGWLTIGIAMLMCLAPSRSPQLAPTLFSGLLFLASLAEVAGGAHSARWSRGAIVIGGLCSTTAAAIAFAVGPNRFLTLAGIITVWLLTRALELIFIAFRAPDRFAKLWLLWSGIANALLAATAISIAVLISFAYLLFGPWPRLAEYSLIPALSIFLTGLSFAILPLGPRPGSDRPCDFRETPCSLSGTLPG